MPMLKKNSAAETPARPGFGGFDLESAPPVNEFGARECPDGIYRNQWGCRFCSVEGCGLVSDWSAGGREYCSFHAAATRCESEMTEVLHRYRPLVIAAKTYDRVITDEAKAEVFEVFRTLVRKSGFNCVPQMPSGATTAVMEPLARDEISPGQRFVPPAEYFTAVALAHASYAAERKAASRVPGEAAAKKARRQLDALRKKISALGATWTRATTPRTPAPAAADDYPF